MYSDGLSPSKIVGLIPNSNLNPGKIHWCLAKHKVKTRSCSEARRVYHFDEGYFAKIDSHEKAQVLGFIAADGCITESKRGQKVLRVTIHKMDTDCLEHIKKSLRYDGPIFDHRVKYVTLGITSATYFHDLINLGVTQRKSLTLLFPTPQQVPDEFLSSYICGYFEGDGSIHIRRGRKMSIDANLSFCATREWGEVFRKILVERLGVTTRIYRKKCLRKRDINSYSVYVLGNKQVIKVVDWMYQNVPFKMMRKFGQVQEIKNLYNEGGDFIKTDEWRKIKKQKFLDGMKRNGRDPSQNEKKEVFYLSPENAVFHIKGVAAFSREMGLQCAGLSRLNGGFQAKYRGWSLPTPSQISAARSSGTLIEKFY